MQFKDYGFIIDSTSRVDQKYLDNYDILVCDLSLRVDDQELPFNTDSKIIIDYLSQNKQVKTSQPSPDSFLKSYQKLLSMGKKKIVVITLSSTLSGTYNAAKVAVSMLDEKDQEKIHLFDSQQAGNGVSFFLYKIIENLEKGKDLEETLKKYEKIAYQSYTYLLVDDLSVIYNSGRLGKVKYTIGNLLKIKPILKFQHNKLEQDDKAIGRLRAIKLALEKLKVEIQNHKKGKLYIMTQEVEGANQTPKILEFLSNYKNIEVIQSGYSTAVITAHVGGKTVGLFVAKEEE